MTEKKDIEFIKENVEDEPKERGILRGVIDGSLLTRKSVVQQFPFVLFLVFLGLIYIGNRYHADSVKRDREILRLEINELRSKAVYVSAELMKISRQTEVAEAVKKKGLELEESVNPPKKILIKEKKNKK